MVVALKLAVLRSGVRQYVLASNLGVSESRLSRIIGGRVVPTEHERMRLAALLGRDESSLFDCKPEDCAPEQAA